jgi:hypothetical protein
MKINNFLMTAALAALIPLGACQTGTPPGAPADLTFSQLAPLSLNVGVVQVQNMAPAQAPSVNLPNISPAAALETYARRRFQAAGGDGTLSFIIQQAQVSVAEGEAGPEWTKSFQLSKPLEYTVTMRVGVNVDRNTQATVKSSYALERKKTLAENVSLTTRDREINDLIAGMVTDLGKSIEKGIAQNMNLLGASPSITYGMPVSTGPVTVIPLD